MANFRMDTVLHMTSGIPADSAVMTTHWNAIDQDAVEVAATKMIAFLNNLAGGNDKAVGQYISPEVNRGPDACEVRIYELPNVPGPLGSPFFTLPFELIDPISDISYPSEVAAVLSYRGSYDGVPEIGPGNTRLRARRRGRFYIGPLNEFCSESFGAPVVPPRPKLQFREDVTKSAFDFLSNNITPSAALWVQFSQTDWQYNDIELCWMDDAFDTQRRRGVEAVVRTTHLI